MPQEMSTRRRGTIVGLRLLMWISTGATASLVVFLTGYILIKGIPFISWEFLTTSPSYLTERIGILPDILNTLYIMITKVSAPARREVFMLRN